MSIVTVSTKGQLVIPKKIRDVLGIKPKQKVLLKIVKGHAEIEPLPQDPIEHFCGIFREGTSLTEALLKEREKDKRREEKKFARFIRSSRLSKTRKKL